MKKDVVVIGALVAAFVVYLMTRKSTTSIGPLVPIASTSGGGTVSGPSATPSGATTDARAALVNLCEAAPLRSFGAGCEGITWIRDSLNNPTELRTAPVPILDTTTLTVASATVPYTGAPEISYDVSGSSVVFA
jgi:hypothetical protein